MLITSYHTSYVVAKLQLFFAIILMND